MDTVNYTYMLLSLRNIFLEFDWDNENPSKLQTFCIDIEPVSNKHLLLLKKVASICAKAGVQKTVRRKIFSFS